MRAHVHTCDTLIISPNTLNHLHSHTGQEALVCRSCVPIARVSTATPPRSHAHNDERHQDHPGARAARIHRCDGVSTVQTGFSCPYPKPTPHTKLQPLLDRVIYKLVFSWRPKNVSTRLKLTGLTVPVGTFGPYNVENSSTHTDRRADTRRGQSLSQQQL